MFAKSLPLMTDTVLFFLATSLSPDWILWESPVKPRVRSALMAIDVTE